MISRDKLRDLLLGRAVKKSVEKTGAGSGIEGLSAAIHNDTRKEFTVRSVVLATNIGDLVLRPTGQVNTSSRTLTPKLTRKQKRILKQGGQVEVSTVLEYRSWRVPEAPDGFVTVHPFTYHDFRLPLQALAGQEFVPKCFKILIEYRTWRGQVKLLHVESKAWNNDYMVQTVRQLREQLLDGSLNDFRSKFGLHPIPLPGNIETNGAADRQASLAPQLEVLGATVRCRVGATVDPRKL